MQPVAQHGQQGYPQEIAGVPASETARTQPDSLSPTSMALRLQRLTEECDGLQEELQVQRFPTCRHPPVKHHCGPARWRQAVTFACRSVSQTI